MGALVAATVLLLVLSACDGSRLSGTRLGVPPPEDPYVPQGAILEDATHIFTTRYTQRTDILVVIDNSGSMSEERAAVQSSMGGSMRGSMRHA